MMMSFIILGQNISMAPENSLWPELCFGKIL